MNFQKVSNPITHFILILYSFATHGELFPTLLEKLAERLFLVGKIHVEVSPEFDNMRGYIRSFSSFNQKTKERLIQKERLTGKAVEENIEGHKKSSIINKMKVYKEDPSILVKKDDKTFIVPEPTGSFVALDETFYKKMLKTFNSDTNNIYIWLYRRYHYLRGKGKRCLFSKGQIVTEALGQSDQHKNRQKVETALTQLCLNGLISYNIVRSGRTFLRELTYIGQKFIVVDAVEAHIENIVGGNELPSADGAEGTFEVVSSIGLSADKINRALSGEDVLLLEG